MKLNETQITLLNKWLNHEADEKDIAQMKEDVELMAYIKLSEKVEQFSPPESDFEALFEKIKKARLGKNKKASVIKYLWPVAAAVALLFAVYTFLPQGEMKQIEVAYASDQTLTLPDASEVIINAGSSLSYNPKRWKKERLVKLTGEAFFKVAKGQKFTVQTQIGEVAVLGTQFNVKQRAAIFQVSCYEGRVEVSAGNDKLVLHPGEYVRLSKGKLLKQSTAQESPSWTKGRSHFEEETLLEVIAEMERQYNIKVHIGTDVRLTETFTGGFTDSDLEAALQAVCLPLHLQYTIEDSKTVRIDAVQ